MKDFPHAWARLAWEEGHRPLHLTGVSQSTSREHGAMGRRKAGETAAILRELAEQGLYISEAARQAGISPSTASDIAKRNRITFRRGNTMEGRRLGRTS